MSTQGCVNHSLLILSIEPYLGYSSHSLLVIANKPSNLYIFLMRGVNRFAQAGASILFSLSLVNLVVQNMVLPLSSFGYFAYNNYVSS